MDLKVTKQPDGYFVAIDADDYDVEFDTIGAWSNSPAGYGKTELEAIRELLAEIEGRIAARAPRRLPKTILDEPTHPPEQDK